MTRAFLALTLEEAGVDAVLAVQAGVPFGHAVPADHLHLTLVFLGDQTSRMLDDVADLVGDLPRIPPEISFEGLSHFGKDGDVSSVHALVKPVPELVALQTASVSAVRAAGISVPRRRFLPHVTLLRSARSERTARVERWLTPRVGWRAGPFWPEALCLFESVLTPDGPQYSVLERWDFPDFGEDA
ncbi:MAG: RNA 2',3'-cyclic phosphodiesterase [Pseudomonadota bacterium]